MKGYELFILLLMTLLSTVECYSISTVANVITAVRKHFQSGCLYLMYNAQYGNIDSLLDQHILQLSKLLSENNERIAAVNIAARNISTLNMCQHNRPLFVLLALSESTSLSFIKNISSKEIWLLYLGSETISTVNLIECLHLPFDSEFLMARPSGKKGIIISEVYRISMNHPLYESHFGNWDEETGLLTTNLTFNRRRSDLSGITLSATVMNNPPSVRLLEKEDGSIEVNGIIGHALDILKEEINFKVNYTLPDVMKWGVFENGSWDGMIGQVQRKEVDMALNGFFMTRQRMDVIDYTLPFLHTRYSVFIKQPETMSLKWANFLAPFSLKLWIAVVSVIILLALYLALLYSCGRRYGNQEAESPQNYDLYDSFLYMFGVFCSQGHYLSPRSNSCRLVYLIANLIAVVLLSAYSGTLISFLTVHHRRLPFNDIEGVLSDDNYKFGLYNIPDEWYKGNESFPTLHKAYVKTIARDPLGLPSSAMEGLKRVCGIKFAFLVPMDTALAHANDINCSLAALPRGSFKASLSIALAKHSPYKNIFTYKLHELRDAGIVHKLRQSEWAPKYEEPQPWRRVGFDETTPIFTILIIGLVASCLMLVLERRFSPFCYRMRPSTPNTVSKIGKTLYRYQHFKYPLSQDQTINEAFPFLQ